MPTNINPAFRLGRHPADQFFALTLLICFVLALAGTSGFLTSCSPDNHQAVVSGANAVPTPSVEFGTEIRGRVAALTMAQVAKTPGLATWGNELAKVCFQLSDVDLPTPATLRGYFHLAAYFVPQSAKENVTDYSEELLTLYTADYPVALAAQQAGAPYLTLVGQGIQDGIKAGSL